MKCMELGHVMAITTAVMSVLDFFRPGAGSYRDAIISVLIGGVVLVGCGLAGWFWVGFPAAVLIGILYRIRSIRSSARNRKS